VSTVEPLARSDIIFETKGVTIIIVKLILTDEKIEEIKKRCGDIDLRAKFSYCGKSSRSHDEY